MSIQNTYIAHNTMLFRSWLDGIHPHTASFLNDPTYSHNPIETLFPKIFSVPILTREWCQILNQEFHFYDMWRKNRSYRYSPPNSMHEYGVMLSQMGLDKPIQELTEKVIVPIIAPLYPEVESHKIDSVHGFSVQYGQYGDQDLGFHVDASTVTVNICLGESWEGGDLYFQGRRCALHRQEPHREEEHYTYKHQVGEMLIHAGAHRHGVYPILSGFRRNIILWYSVGPLMQETICPSWCQHNP